MIQLAQDYKPSFQYKFIRERANNTGDKFILDDFIALDTETSHNHDADNPIGWIYQWCFAIGEDVVIGRKPSEFIDCLNRVSEYAHLEENRRCVIYVHNLSYDASYLFRQLNAEYGEAKILAIANHKLISMQVGNFIFKCSYKLSNKSLEKWCNDLGTKHKKLVGAIDYDTIRYQDTELEQIDWDYQIEDVLTLRECIQKQMEIYQDTLATIPLTSTGYIRRVARQNYKKNVDNRKKFLQTALDSEVYIRLRKAFAGGMTHGNRFYSERTVKGRIKHRDFRSHYPSQQRTQGFPIDKFNLYKRNATIADVRKAQEMRCCLIELTLLNPRLKETKTTMPYISEAKARQGMKSKCHFISDNGRILSCRGMFTIYLTELDFKWIMEQYEFDAYAIPTLYTSMRGRLPEYMIETIDTFFEGKTEYKDKVEELKRTLKQMFSTETETLLAEANLDLMKSKNGLNGIYGMSATDIVRASFELNEDTGEWLKTEARTTEEIDEALAKYYKSKNNFMRYQFGVWTTAHARNELMLAVGIIEKTGGIFLYADTDSAFYLTTDKTEEAMKKWNEMLLADSEKKKAYIITKQGKKVHYNQFEDEKEDITHFRFLHAKCYGYIADGKLSVTIAGVSPYEDATRKYSREEELGDLSNLKNGFVFTRCGGTKAKYVEMKPTILNIDGHNTEVASSCIIERTTKTLSNDFSCFTEYVDWEVVS